MAQQISSSIRKRGANLASNVFIVQFHLANCAAPTLRNRLVVPLSGVCDAATVAASSRRSSWAYTTSRESAHGDCFRLRRWRRKMELDLVSAMQS
jgi:hypothetical protein